MCTHLKRVGTIAAGSEVTVWGQVAATTVTVTSEGPTRPTRVDARSTTLVSAAGDAVFVRSRKPYDVLS